MMKYLRIAFNAAVITFTVLLLGACFWVLLHQTPVLLP